MPMIDETGNCPLVADQLIEHPFIDRLKNSFRKNKLHLKQASLLFMRQGWTIVNEYRVVFSYFRKEFQWDLC